MTGRTFRHFNEAWAVKRGLPTLVPAQEPPPAPPRAGPPQAQPWWRGLVQGESVECTDTTGVFRKCNCGSTSFVVTAGAGPHAAGLQCGECGRGGRWLSKRYFEITA
jgi:hypothetical protein